MLHFALFSLPWSRDWVGISGLVKTLPKFSRQHRFPAEPWKLTFFLPEVPLDPCMLVGTHSLCRRDLAGPSRIPQVPEGGGGGRRHIPFPGVMESSEPEVGLEPRDHPSPPFLMRKLRPRAVEWPVYGRSAALAELDHLLHRAVLFLGFGGGDRGFSSLIKVAGGLWTWHSLPQVDVLEARQLVPPGSTGLPAWNQHPPYFPSGLADSWRVRLPSEPSSDTSSTPSCSMVPSHSTTFLTPLWPLVGPSPPRVEGRRPECYVSDYIARGDASSRGWGRKGLSVPACWDRTPSWCPGPLGQPGHLAWQTSHQVPSVPRQSHWEEAAYCLCGLLGWA